MKSLGIWLVAFSLGISVAEAVEHADYIDPPAPYEDPIPSKREQPVKRTSDEPGSKTNPLPYPVGGLDETEWEGVSCLSTGACSYKKLKGDNMGAIVWFKKTKEQLEAEAKKFDSKVVPASGTEKVEDKKLTDNESKQLYKTEIESEDHFKEIMKLAAKSGKKYVVMQVGNLPGCGPCQALNTALRKSDLNKKEGETVIYDFLYHTADGGAGKSLKAFLHKDLALPAAFNYPYTYIFRVDPKTGWPDNYHVLTRDQASAETVAQKIESLKNWKK